MIPLQVLLPSDVFPPRCGGAGWSAHALALALQRRGHTVTAVVPQQGFRSLARDETLGVPAIRYGYWTPRIPIVQNYFRHERLWPRLAELLVELAAAADRRSLIIHAQHVQTTPPAVMAGGRLGAPVVVTVRDHWPWDYFATGLHGERMPYQQQTWASLATDLASRLGPLRGALALPAIPAMLAHLERRRRLLARADAVIAVSQYIARRLAGIVAPERLYVLPNMVDIAAIDAAIGTPPVGVTPGEPYLLYVGKLERNKGAQLLVDIFREFRQLSSDTEASPWRRWPLVIAGDGPLRAELEQNLASLGVPARFLAWADHDEVLRLMAHCGLLLFPSAWGEPLSRVLLEACACAAPILAMPTGGTPEIVEDGVSGALEPTPECFARRMVQLLDYPAQRRALGAAARRAARERFDATRLVTRIETLYLALLGKGGSKRGTSPSENLLPTL